jgi:DNA/RNA-binding domain of Phe-tRNA-synthetase-like protein
VSSAADPVRGWRSAQVERELPGLALLQHETSVGRAGALDGGSPPDVLERLRERANRLRGSRVVTMRREPVPSAYRVFFRHVGIDPDVQFTPLEAAVVTRMLHGGFPSGGLLADILLIALLDTGVAVWALDASTLDGPLGIRLGEPSDSLAQAGELAAGRLVVADMRRALASLFGAVAQEHRPRGACERVRLFAVQVPGVPALYVEEALWSCASSLQAP